MHLLFIILFFILSLVVIIVLSIIIRIIRMGRNFTNLFRKESREQKKQNASSSPNKEKVFNDDEGEYVDYEEIKEEN